MANPVGIAIRSWLTPSVVIALGVVAALVLRMYRLGAQSLWLDEGGTWVEVTRNSWRYLIADLFCPTAAYPFYHLLMKAWVALAGDSEWALRFPSALAGAAMVGAIAAAAREMGQWETRPLGRSEGYAPSPYRIIIPSLIAALSPYALWHAQDAKVYSMLTFVVALLLWLAQRALHFGGTRDWLALGLVACVSVFIHRLALLPLAGLLAALAVAFRQRRATTAALGITAVGAGMLGVVGLARSVASNGWQESGHSAAGPFASMWLNLQHFILDRGDIGGFAGIPLGIWALPALALTAWGVVALGRAAWRGEAGALVVLALFVVPLALFALALVFTPVYESRYAAVAFPAWVLVMTYPVARTQDSASRTKNKEPRTNIALLASRFLVLCSVLISVVVLLQPQHGLFSGAPVKEQWREGIAAVALEAHPDDLIVLHPYYTLPLWQYYAPRVTPDPLPQPTVFVNFGTGSCVERYRGQPVAIRECFKQEYDPQFNQAAYGKKRALLLIAPDHAATIDPPKSLAELNQDFDAGIIDEQPTEADQYGWVGLRFAISQRSWPCGSSNSTFVGVEVMCQSYPELYKAGSPSAPPAPAVPLEAIFGNEIKLRGYSIDLLGQTARPGGTLPITLYWESIVDPTKNYSMFIHLCQDCEQPPLAQVDEPPLHGNPPAGWTSTWRGFPVHDERSLKLPATLSPGRYTLILGIRPADEDWQELSLRLPISDTTAQTLGDTRLVLGTVEIGR